MSEFSNFPFISLPEKFFCPDLCYKVKYQRRKKGKQNGRFVSTILFIV